tara:strand:- start:20 stop:406 length:387 start_codon:yes stop_codon:yes gene_type:complete
MNIAPFKKSLINSGKAIKSNINTSIVYEANTEAAVPIIITPIVLKFTKECKKVANRTTSKKRSRGGNRTAPKVIQREESNIFFISSFPDFKLIALLIPSNTNKLARMMLKDIILGNKAVIKTIKATIG